MHNLIELQELMIHDISPEEQQQLIAALLVDLNAFVSIDAAEVITTLDKTTQYRLRKSGQFPALIQITPQGRRKAYRIRDLKKWLQSPVEYQSE